MPVDQAVLSAAEGATFGLFPIMWIVVTAIWVYNMTVESGHFRVLRRSIASVSRDHRIQAVLIAFCFGTLMEAMAGFGAPAAITAVMMVALGFKPMTATALALLGNTAAVPFGALGIPITTLSEVTGLDKGDLGAMVGRQTPLLGLIVPFILVGIVDGRRGIRQASPAAIGGLAFALAQFDVLQPCFGRADGHRGLDLQHRGDRGAPPGLGAARAPCRPVRAPGRRSP